MLFILVLVNVEDSYFKITGLVFLHKTCSPYFLIMWKTC